MAGIMSSRGYWIIVSKARQTLVTEGLSRSWWSIVVQNSLEGERQPNLPKGIDQQQVCWMVRWHYLDTEQVTCKVLAHDA